MRSRYTEIIYIILKRDERSNCTTPGLPCRTIWTREVEHGESNIRFSYYYTCSHWLAVSRVITKKNAFTEGGSKRISHSRRDSGTPHAMVSWRFFCPSSQLALLMPNLNYFAVTYHTAENKGGCNYYVHCRMAVAFGKSWQPEFSLRVRTIDQNVALSIILISADWIAASASATNVPLITVNWITWLVLLKYLKYKGSQDISTHFVY